MTVELVVSSFSFGSFLYIRARFSRSALFSELGSKSGVNPVTKLLEDYIIMLLAIFSLGVKII